jgi:Mg-chelatase subunit ChlD
MFLSFVHPTYLWLLLLIPLTAGLALTGRRRPTAARFWTALALRVALLALIVGALAGLQVRRRADTLTAVFLLDASDSVPAEERARGEALIRTAIGEMPTGDRAAVIVFGQDALVERIPSEERRLPRLDSAPVTVRTDIAGALQLALALFPDEGARRLVLLSDGRENVGHAVNQAELAAAHGVELTYVPLGDPAGEVEVLIESLDAPADVRQGQRFDLTAVVRSTAATAATLRVFADGQLVHSREVRLQEGTQRLGVPVDAQESGFRRFRAQIVPDADGRLQNNEASAFTVVRGPPRVLLVEGQPGEGEALARALGAAGMVVETIRPPEFPTTLPELGAFEATILANVPAVALPSEALALLETYVRDLGKGLLATGGETAFGAGGYMRTPVERALPVDMDVRSKDQSPNLALVLVVDKSGSMGRCHCDNPDAQRGEYVAVESGQAKVDIAKEAVMRAAGALGPRDYLGVVAFDDLARWAVEVSPLVDPLTLERSIGALPAQGQSNLRAGLETAYQALQGVEARFKHVILLTDGWVREGEMTPLAVEMREQGITLSIVAAGQGAARYLADLAESGGGRFYPAEDVLQVPDFFLKETVEAVGEYIVEEPFYPLPGVPSPVLRDLDAAALPPLRGYNGTTPKGAARVVLTTLRGDPLLATWQYGLGRSAAWTSDLKGQWAAAWLAWEGFPRFAAQLVDWTLPAPQAEGLAARATLEEGTAFITAEAVDPLGRPQDFLQVTATVIGPDLEALALPLPQVGAGTYRAPAALVEPGTYLVRVDAAQGDEALGQQTLGGQLTLGLVIPYSPEYARSGTDRGLLDQLARLTGGAELAAPLRAFAHDLPSAARARDAWYALLIIAALLFPLDVALRRVTLGSRDLARAAAWVGARLPRRRAARAERVLGRLFAARDRGRARTTREAAETQDIASGRAQETQDVASLRRSPLPPGGDETPADALARLRRAKERAQRR